MYYRGRKMRWLLAMFCVLTVGCSEADSKSTGAAASKEAALPEAPKPPAYPPGVSSLMLVRSITVRFEPEPDSKKLGTVAAHTRVAWKGAGEGPGCEQRWIEIEPRGWVCETYMRPSTKPPHGVELPKLEEGEVVPGVYGKVVAEGAWIYRLDEEGIPVPEREIVGKATVRKHRVRTFDGEPYWHIGGGEFLPAASVREHRPSEWHGVSLGETEEHELPLGFALSGRGRPAPVFDAAEGGAQIRKLEPREVVPVLDTSYGADGAPIAHRIDEEAWVRAADLRVAEKTDPPPGTREEERWIDLDLDGQLLVAYEGQEPVFATLVSTGKRKTPTETGIYRIWIKFSETDMTGAMSPDAPSGPRYFVATVPWTQFFAPDIALHTAYWHDRFGIRQSHGCVNLTPRDARFLYFWTAPDVPDGWTMAHGIRERPGSMVRVRSAEDPTPEFKGYARHVHEARIGEG